ncbi:MAG TPA: hypothetical protein VJP79_07815, partial [Nitrososphaera sp.]|nr:hypothetical protein [Nitrososphaera sp.]
GGLVDRAAAKRVPLSGLDNVQIGLVLKTLKVSIDAQDVAETISDMTPEKSIQSRKSIGSPSSAQQAEMSRTILQGVRNYKLGVQKRIKMVEGAFGNLASEVRRYQGS